MPKDTNKENVSPNLRQARQKAAAWPYRVPTLGGPNGTTRMGPPVQTTSNAPRTKTLPNRQVVPKSNIPVRCRGKCCATCHPGMRVPSKAINVQPRVIAWPCALNPHALRRVTHFGQQVISQPRPQIPLQPLPQSQFQLQHYPQVQIQPQVRCRPQVVPGVPPPSFSAAPPIPVAPTQTNNPQPQNNPRGLSLSEYAPGCLDTEYVEPLLQLDVINQYDGPAGIWPLAVQTRLESGLHTKVANHPQAKLPLQSIEICLVSTAFKMGARRRNGFRWVALLLPKIKYGRKPDPILHLPFPNQQCAWLLDPCAPMEGREFLQFLDPETLMLRRKLHLRPIINAFCEQTLDAATMIWRMENWDEEWKNVLCRSVTHVTEPRNLALGTGLWITALYQVAYSPVVFETSAHFTMVRNVLATKLESIGSRELGLPFLQPVRLQLLSGANN